MKNLYRSFSAIILFSLMFISVSAQKLVGEWKLVEAKQNGKKVSLGREIKTNLVLGEENRMSGNAGCNRYSTAYTLKSKNRIKFQPIISTKMACLDNDFTKQESTFFSVIEKGEKYKIKGNYLIFSDVAEQNILRFARVYKQKS
jgi:copper homeostasis protein (lipoprotein)